ncbi:venom acid phosphatase Acph-1-like [Macrosteles quadrilineatus]|uniref:venom acid phosphatase Acph-1-like n=1 Tax=Macrosteles quadrilineatus TaxID=74068 RepID=UPI0023E2DFC9|nr:venom acid phosphatase Acph-1-like [Macrosteles quadrilineatus]
MNVEVFSFFHVTFLLGPLYFRVYDLLRSKVNGNLTQGHKMYLHAGHDISVLSLLRGIGYKPLHIVRPGDCVFLELHNLSNIYYVKIFYLSLLTTGEEFRELHVPGCPLPCPLSTFLTLATPLSPSQWAAECSS